ncbi:MAG: lipid IV(A) 3-deoxy-D-manno-octulosonic acid transferase [Gammaproteobacteria bacterium]|jgi:3-deoxy-D-manno-octulosonic-acid transferase
MYFLYSLILYLSVPLVLLRLLWLGRRNPAYLHRWRERFGYCRPPAKDCPVIWIHAVSVGEAQAAQPLAAQLFREYPDHQLLFSTVTPTGARRVEQLFHGGVEHRYFPYDLPGAVGRFLARIKPVLVIVMETEIWPNLYRRCRRRGIPVVLVNARLSERSWRGYRRFLPLAAATLRCLSLIAAQSRADADRFLSLGAAPESVKVTGNLKFDVKQPHSVTEAGEVMRRFFSVNRPVWIAASTHEGEEAAVLDAFSRVLEKHGDCLLILAPRHPERAPGVTELARRHGFQPIRHSDNGGYSVGTRVYVLDTLGELPVFYAASDVSFVGGSLVPAGGHNLLEPAALGIPVISGPHLFNFAEAADLLAGAGALYRVSTAVELASRVDCLLKDANLRHGMGEKGRQAVLASQGTLHRLLDSLQPVIP